MGWTLALHTLPAPTRQLKQLVSSRGEAPGEGARELRLNLGNSSQIVSSPPRDPPFPVARGHPSSHIFPQASASPRALTSPEFLGPGSPEPSILETMQPKLPGYTGEETPSGEESCPRTSRKPGHHLDIHSTNIHQLSTDCVPDTAGAASEQTEEVSVNERQG